MINKHLFDGTQYELKKELGQGGFATVYLAYDKELNRNVAIKLLDAKLSRDNPKFLERFKREAQVMASLRHPGIIDVYAIGELKGQPYIVMPYLPNSDLRTLIRQKKTLDPKVAMRVITQLGGTLDYAHHKGRIIHRDIKPANVLFDEHYNAILTDFGIARVLLETAMFTTSNSTFGTPHYMAPEQWTKPKDIDGRVDLYALGVMSYQMLTGQTPFDADTPHALMYAHLQEPPPPAHTTNANLPRAVSDVLAKMMAKSPDDRYQTGTQFAEALQAVIFPQRVAPTISKPPSHRDAPDSNSKKRGLRCGCSIVAMLLAVMVCVAGTLFWGPSMFALNYNSQGNGYFSLGNYEQAITSYTQAIDLDRDYALAYYNRGAAYRRLGNYEQAIADYTRAIDLDPDFALAYNNRGLAYYSQGNYTLAIADYTSAIAVNPDFAIAYYNRGLAYHSRRSYTQAIADYESYLELAPNAPERATVERWIADLR